MKRRKREEDKLRAKSKPNEVPATIGAAAVNVRTQLVSRRLTLCQESQPLRPRYVRHMHASEICGVIRGQHFTARRRLKVITGASSPEQLPEYSSTPNLMHVLPMLHTERPP